MDALYVRLDETTFRSTDLTQGPWDPKAQHGGAPGALIAGAVESVAGLDGDIARLSIEILGPIPLADLEVTARVLRPGRRIELIGAEMRTGDRLVATAAAWRFARQAVDVPPPVDPPEPVPGPELGEPDSRGRQGGYAARAMEIRYVEGSMTEPGPATAWFRLTVPVVGGEPISPLQRATAAADFSNGVGKYVGFDTHLFINTDLTVNLHRTPTGVWIGLRATSHLGSTGRGQAWGVLHDEEGPVGRSSQTLFVSHR